MVAETWLYNPWVVAIGSGILLILFEEIISAYKEKKYTIGHVGNEQRFVAFCFIKLIFYKPSIFLTVFEREISKSAT